MTANQRRVWIAYWRQYVWFYAWRWSMPVTCLHRLTIMPLNQARHAYLDLHRKYWWR